MLTQQATVSEFDVHPKTGEILMSVHSSGSIKKLVYLGLDDESLPQTLTQTGAFDSVADLSTATGVFPYEPIVSFWSDHAIKQRWFSLPGTDPFEYSTNEPWVKPLGSVFIKHFELEMERGVPESRRRIETRFLVMSDFGAYGVSYQWDEAGESAQLAPSEGVNLALDIIDENGQPMTQNWRIPSRSQCMECHTRSSDFVLSFNTRQLHQEGATFGEEEHMIRALTENGYLSNGPSEEDLQRILPLAEKDDLSVDVEHRARSYLAANCMPCHQEGGTAPANFDLRPHLALHETLLINGPVGNDVGGGVTSNHRLIVPGDIQHSVLLQRLCACDGFSRMPPLASNEIDEEGVQLIADWILSLEGYQTWDAWREAHFPDEPLVSKDGDADSDGLSNELEFLAKTDPNDGSEFWRQSIEVSSTQQVTFRFEVPARLPLVVERSPNLIDWELWEPVTPYNSRQGQTKEVPVPLSEQPLFLRVVDGD